jgi:hypothetical protein
MSFTRTHNVYNPTASTVTVNSNSVQAHSSAVLTISDEDAQAFKAGGCTTTQIEPGTADAAHLVGYTRGY